MKNEDTRTRGPEKQRLRSGYEAKRKQMEDKVQALLSSSDEVHRTIARLLLQYSQVIDQSEKSAIRYKIYAAYCLVAAISFASLEIINTFQSMINEAPLDVTIDSNIFLNLGAVAHVFILGMCIGGLLSTEIKRNQAMKAIGEIGAPENMNFISREWVSNAILDALSSVRSNRQIPPRQ